MFSLHVRTQTLIDNGIIISMDGKGRAKDYIYFYNHRRFHQTLEYKKPMNVYCENLKINKRCYSILTFHINSVSYKSRINKYAKIKLLKIRRID